MVSTLPSTPCCRTTSASNGCAPPRKPLRLGLDRVRQLLNTRRRLELTLTEHKTIVSALEAHDGEAAARAMYGHLDAVMAELETFARERPELFADLNNTGGTEA